MEKLCYPLGAFEKGEKISYRICINAIKGNDMRISLLTKFFFSFLVTGIVLVGILISLIQFYAFRNFSDYVTQNEYSQLDELVVLLEQSYRQNGNWAFLEQNHNQWQSLLRIAGLISDEFPPPKFQGAHLPGPHPGVRPRPNHPLDPAQPPPAGTLSPNRPRHNRLNSNLLGPRISLLDQEKNLIMGHPPQENAYLRTIPEQGAIIGYLSFNRAANLSHPLDLNFVKEQKKSFYLAGILFLAGSVLVSFLLAFHLLAPIKKLSRATRALGRRKFGTRIDISTRDELEQLARDFNRMALTLGDYEQRQVQWLSDISHELRTPLSILKGELEAVQDGIHPMDDKKVDSLYSEVSHLIRLVNDIHDLSMAEAEIMALIPRSIDADTLLIKVLDRFRPKLDQKGTRILTEMKTGITIWGDPDRLTQLFSNVIKNSLAYTDPPGILKISLVSQGKSVFIGIEDSGPGLDEHLLSRIFDRMVRGEVSRNRKKGGSGLGLAICQHIVKAHEGRISAGPSELGGIKIKIQLPLPPD